MDSKGVSLALNSVGIAILVLVVVLVLGFIFFGFAARFMGIEDGCGEGTFDAYECHAERPGEGHCFRTSSDSCASWQGDQADGTVFCCRGAI